MCSVNTIGENVTGNNMKERDTNEERKESFIVDYVSGNDAWKCI